MASEDFVPKARLTPLRRSLIRRTLSVLYRRVVLYPSCGAVSVRVGVRGASCASLLSCVRRSKSSEVSQSTLLLGVCRRSKSSASLAQPTLLLGGWRRTVIVC